MGSWPALSYRNTGKVHAYINGSIVEQLNETESKTYAVQVVYYSLVSESVFVW